jgi:outer membrane protein assembly factor BamD (BamD/ComL family)
MERLGRLVAGLRPAAPIIALLAACASPPPAFDDVAPAEELYDEATKTLKGRRIIIRIVNYTKAIETFQAIIDNYPYSD